MANVSVVSIGTNTNMGTALTLTERHAQDFGDESQDMASDTTSPKLQYGTNWEHLDHKMATEKMISRLRGKMKHRLGVKNNSKPFQQLDEYLTTLVTSEQAPKKPQSSEDIQSDKENFGTTSCNHVKTESQRNTSKIGPSTSNSSPCQRCGSSVYFAERIEPNRGQILHKSCFKCKQCGVKLTLNTFFSNQVELSDLEVYCKSHVPRHKAGIKQEQASTPQQDKIVSSHSSKLKYDEDSQNRRKERRKPSYLPNDIVKSEVIGLRYF